MRIGRFYISDSLYTDELQGYESIRAVLANVAVTSCRYRQEKKVYEFVGVSPLFDDVDEGYLYPDYQFIVQNIDGTIIVSEVIRLEK